MKHFIFNDVKVSLPDSFNVDDVLKYINIVLDHVDPALLKTNPLKSVIVKLCDDGKVDIDYTLQGEKFERISYLTGDLTSWNNAKRAEERERVKHIF